MNEQVGSMSVEDLVTLVNEYADITRQTAGESMDSYPELTTGFMGSASDAELVTVANDLHAVFADPDRAIDRVNQMADASGLAHRLGSDGRLRWTKPDQSDHLASAALACLIDLMSAHGTTVLGTCGADHCVDVYVDNSQAKSREYCSVRCNNNARATRWRARRSTGSQQIR